MFVTTLGSDLFYRIIFVSVSQDFLYYKSSDY